MEAAQKEPFERKSYAPGFPTADAEHYDSSLASAEEKAVHCTETIGAAATGGLMQSGIMVSTEMDSSHSSNKEERGDTGATYDCGSISAGVDGDSPEVRSVPVNTEEVLETKEIVEVIYPNDLQMGAIKQGNTAMASNEAEDFDCVAIANDLKVSPTMQGNPSLSPRGLNREDKVTIASQEDSIGVAVVLGCGGHVNQKMTFTGTIVSNQGKALDVTLTNKQEGSNSVDTTFHSLEETQVEEDAYDMDFDLFDEEHCMFPPLDADKAESWHAAVEDDVIMEESSAPVHNNQHSHDIKRVQASEGSNKEADALHEVKENAARKEDWLSDTRHKPCSKAVHIDSNLVEENMVLNNTHIQVKEVDFGDLGHEADVATLSDGIQGKELAFNNQKINSSKIQGQDFADDGVACLECKNVESINDAGTCETKNMEEEVKITGKEEFVSASVSETPGHAATDLRDQEMPWGQSVYNVASADFNIASKDAVHDDTEAADLLKDTRLVTPSYVERGIASHIVAQGNVVGQELECLDLASKDKSVDVNYRGLNPMEESMDKSNASPIHCPAAPQAESTLNVEHNTKAESTSDVEHNMKAEDLLEDARLQSCTVEKGIRIQIEGQGKVTSQDIGELDLAKKEDPVDAKPGGLNVRGQSVIKANTSPIHCSGALAVDSSALALQDVAEPEQVPKACEQNESSPITDCKEMPLEALSEVSTQREMVSFEQNAMLEEFSGHNNETRDCDGFLSETLHFKRSLESWGNEPAIMDGELNPTILSNGVVCMVTSNDADESHGIENEGTDVIKAACQDAKALNVKNRHGELYVGDNDYCAKEPSNSKPLEVLGGGEDAAGDDEVMDARVETINEEACGKTSIEGFEEFDGGSVIDCHSDVDEIFHMKEGIVEGQGAGTEQQIEAPNEVQVDHYLMQQSCTPMPGANGDREGKNQEVCGKASFQRPSSPYPETGASLEADLAEKVRLFDVSEDTKKFTTEEYAAPVEPTGSGRRASATDALSNKQPKRKRLETDDKDCKLGPLTMVEQSFFNDAHENVHVGDYNIAKSESEQADDSSLETILKPIEDGLDLDIGDLVWAKVKSHPWWPAQIFDPADASKSARKAEKTGKVLAAFFGDCTFAWLQQSQMIPFRSNFEEKAQQTTMRIFCLAVEEALEELCRRSELSLSCEHFKGSLYSSSSFPEANTGIRESARIERLRDICTCAEMFRPKKTLDFVKSVAASPLGEWRSTLQWAESRGYAYGLRTCMVAMQAPESIVLSVPTTVCSQESKLKGSHSSLAAGVPDAEGGGKERKKGKKLKSEKKRKGIDGNSMLAGAVSTEQSKADSSADTPMKSDTRYLAESGERNKSKNIIKIKLSKMSKFGQLSSSKRHLDTLSGKEAGEAQNVDDGKETLLAIAGHAAKVFRRSSTKESKISTSVRSERKQIGEESQKGTNSHQAVKANAQDGLPDTGGEALVTTKTDIDDPFSVPPSPPLRDRIRKLDKPDASIKLSLKREASIKDSAVKGESVRKFRKVGDSIRKVASELKGTPIVKDIDDLGPAGLKLKKITKGPQLESQTSPVCGARLLKDSPEDVSLLQLHRDLELLAKNAGSGGAEGRAVKQSKRGEPVEVGAAKSLSHRQSIPQRSQRSCVQELALVARKRKSEIVHGEVLLKLSRNDSTTSSQQSDRSKSYITSAERLGRRRSYDKSLLVYSRRPPPPDFSSKSSGQRYNEKLSSHAPLGLFMRFPEDFPLPTETQLKAAFIPFGPLHVSATRLYKDSTSAQVVFKHGRDAELAFKHAKKNPIFGQVAVTYRLRHLSHSTKAEMKTGNFLSSKGHSSQAGVLRDSAPLRKNREGTSGFLESGIKNNEGISSTILRSSCSDSRSVPEPTGDIQDQMLTLLRQVSVIVNTSPVASDGT